MNYTIRNLSYILCVSLLFWILCINVILQLEYYGCILAIQLYHGIDFYIDLSNNIISCSSHLYCLYHIMLLKKLSGLLRLSLTTRHKGSLCLKDSCSATKTAANIWWPPFHPLMTKGLLTICCVGNQSLTASYYDKKKNS